MAESSCYLGVRRGVWDAVDAVGCGGPWQQSTMTTPKNHLFGLPSLVAILLKGVVSHESVLWNHQSISTGKASEHQCFDVILNFNLTAVHAGKLHPDYLLLAGRICSTNLHKRTHPSFAKTIELLHHHMNPRNGQTGVPRRLLPNAPENFGRFEQCTQKLAVIPLIFVIFS